MAQPYQGTLLINEGEQSAETGGNVNESQGNCADREAANSKRHRLYGPIYITPVK